jgi:hypothetical protein
LLIVEAVSWILGGLSCYPILFYWVHLKLFIISKLKTKLHKVEFWCEIGKTRKAAGVRGKQEFILVR